MLHFRNSLHNCEVLLLLVTVRFKRHFGRSLSLPSGRSGKAGVHSHQLSHLVGLYDSNRSWSPVQWVYPWCPDKSGGYGSTGRVAGFRPDGWTGHMHRGACDSVKIHQSQTSGDRTRSSQRNSRMDATSDDKAEGRPLWRPPASRLQPGLCAKKSSSERA